MNATGPLFQTPFQARPNSESEQRQRDLHAFIVRRTRLAPADAAEMLALHARYFDNVQPARFHADLAEKEWVILLRDGMRLAGFSTQRMITLAGNGREQRFLFSGDTIVDRPYWHEHLLVGCFGHLMLRLIRELGEDDLYWFLISKGYRTYRFLPVFFHRFLPRPDGQNPPGLEELLQSVAVAKYGTAFNRENGLVVPGECGDRLRPELCDVPGSKRADPYVDFFLKQNPRFQEGHELACLAEIRQNNLNRLAWRVIERTTPVWLE